jgi:hypothetical protein
MAKVKRLRVRKMGGRAVSESGLRPNEIAYSV